MSSCKNSEFPLQWFLRTPGGQDHKNNNFICRQQVYLKCAITLTFFSSWRCSIKWFSDSFITIHSLIIAYPRGINSCQNIFINQEIRIIILIFCTEEIRPSPNELQNKFKLVNGEHSKLLQHGFCCKFLTETLMKKFAVIKLYSTYYLLLFS